MNSMKGLIEFQNVTGGVCHQISEAWKKVWRFPSLNSMGPWVTSKKTDCPKRYCWKATSGNSPNVHLKRCFQAGEAGEASRHEFPGLPQRAGEVRSDIKKIDTVDGWNPAITSWGKGSFSHYLQGFIHPRWCINSITLCSELVWLL